MFDCAYLDISRRPPFSFTHENFCVRHNRSRPATSLMGETNLEKDQKWIDERYNFGNFVMSDSEL